MLGWPVGGKALNSYLQRVILRRGFELMARKEGRRKDNGRLWEGCDKSESVVKAVLKSVKVCLSTGVAICLLFCLFFSVRVLLPLECVFYVYEYVFIFTCVCILISLVCILCVVLFVCPLVRVCAYQSLSVCVRLYVFLSIFTNNISIYTITSLSSVPQSQCPFFSYLSGTIFYVCLFTFLSILTSLCVCIFVLIFFCLCV